jgi:crotonobetainyl-CoA:carnitine CoA-transferase CaiB-like acyl-CoA transferase
MGAKALEDVVVLDLSQFLSGPRCTQILAMKGAQVIKIEPPAGEALRVLTRFMQAERMMSVINQNKKGLVLDLKKPEGVDLFKQLAQKADVVVENFAPGLMDKMGVGWDALRALNPRLIYASISGFGRTGPLADRLAFDIIAQATGGIMHSYKQPDRPPRAYWGDLVSGAYCALGILQALYQRERTGAGQLVDISMQDVMYFHYFGAQSEKALEPVREQVSTLLGRDLTNLMTDETNPLPYWNSYKTKDGHIAVVALTERHWKNLLQAMGEPELINDPRFNNFVVRTQNCAEGVALVSEWMAQRTVREIYETLTAAHVPCAPVLTLEQVNQDPQLAHRGMHCTVRHPSLGAIDTPGDPVKLSASDSCANEPCPELGQHTDELLAGVLGLDQGAIRALHSGEVI